MYPANNPVLIAGNKDSVEKFNNVASALNMAISASKTKCMTTLKTSICSKIVIDNYIIEQEIMFNYIGIEISSNADTKRKVRAQLIQTSRTVYCLNDRKGRINTQNQK